MPIYDYRCESCSHRFDLRQSFTDASTIACPKCEGTARRVIHPAGVVFKGSGWHSTDYRSSGTGSRRNGESDKDGDTEKTAPTDKSGSEKSSSDPAPATSAPAATGAGASDA